MLPSKKRLRSADFKNMIGAKTFHSAHFFARIKRKTEPGETKAAAVVSTQTAKTAVERNLLRRRIYSFLSPHLASQSGIWVVITAKQGAKELTFQELQRELSELLEKEGVL